MPTSDSAACSTISTDRRICSFVPDDMTRNVPGPHARRNLWSTPYISRGVMTTDPLETFTPQVRDWFLRAFSGPTEAQAGAWPAIARGENVLLSAPTGSGKTLAA